MTSAVDALPEECVACIADMLASHGRTFSLEGVHDGWWCNACGKGAGAIVGTRYTREVGEADEAISYDLCHHHFNQLGAEMKLDAVPPPTARPISHRDVTDRLSDLQAMSLVYRPWRLVVMANEAELWKTLTLARYPRTMGIVLEQGPPQSWKQLFRSQMMAERPPPRGPPATLEDFTFTIEPYVDDEDDAASCLACESVDEQAPRPRPRWTGSFRSLAEMRTQPPTLWTEKDAGFDRFNRMRVLVTWGRRTACIYDGGKDRIICDKMEDLKLPCHAPLGESEAYDSLELGVDDPCRCYGEARLMFLVWRYDHPDRMTDADLLRYLTQGLPWELLADRPPPWEQAGAADMYHVPMAKPAKLTDFVFTVEVFSRSKEMQAAFDRNRSSSPSLATAPFEEEEADEPGVPPAWAEGLAIGKPPPYTVGMDWDICAMVYPEKMVARWTGSFSDAKDMVRSYPRVVGGQRLPPHPVERVYPKMWDVAPEWADDVSGMSSHELRQRVFVTWRERTFCLHDEEVFREDMISPLPCNMGAMCEHDDEAMIHATLGTRAYEWGVEIVLGFAINNNSDVLTAMTEAQILAYLTQGVPWQQLGSPVS